MLPRAAQFSPLRVVLAGGPDRPAVALRRTLDQPAAMSRLPAGQLADAAPDSAQLLKRLNLIEQQLMLLIQTLSCCLRLCQLLRTQLQTLLSLLGFVKRARMASHGRACSSADARGAGVAS